VKGRGPLRGAVRARKQVSRVVEPFTRIMAKAGPDPTFFRTILGLLISRPPGAV
jgi:hypothetical protein